MNKKLSLSDIADQLAENAKISKKDAAIFLKNLFDMVEENLIAQKIVKIKGLGTFKLTRMESRKIANVNTGEIQEIPEHYKTTFTPDTALAEAVNEPFAHLETMILDDESIADQPTVVKPEPIEVKTETVKVATPLVEPAPSTEKSETTVTEINTSAETEILEKTKESKSKNGIHWIYYLIGLIIFASATYIGCKFCKFNEPKTPVIASIP
ncbi:MAG: HU family DNA-binding protein, partial [Bacteroidales bacterium]